MMRRAIFVILVILPIVVLASDGKSPADLDPAIKKADDAYAAAVRQADETASKAKADAAKKRLVVYEDRLKYHTKQGDFEKAKSIKDAIDSTVGGEIPKDAARFDGHRYALIKDHVTWHVAKRKCEEMGGRLVCINNKKEELFVANLCGKQLVSIGATDEVEEGRWLNVDGTTAVFSSAKLDNHLGLDHWMVWDGSGFVDWHAGGRGSYVCEWD